MSAGRFECFAPAKVNLSLRVAGRLPSGYHTLSSLICPLKFGDRLTVEIRPGAADLACIVRLSEALKAHLSAVPGQAEQLADSLSSDRNLAARAVALGLEAWGMAQPYSVTIEIDKRIPIEAGLGGGSADAAAALLACAAYFGKSGDEMRLFQLAHQLGSDVPACLARRLIFVEGTGSKLARLEPKDELKTRALLESLELVIVKPFSGVSTGEAFEALGLAPDPELLALQPEVLELGHGGTISDPQNARLFECLGCRPSSANTVLGTQLTSDGWEGISGGPKTIVPIPGAEAELFLALLFNDFEKVIIGSSPEIGAVFEAADRCGARRALLAGSGSGVVCFSNSFDEADRLESALRSAAPASWFIQRTGLLPEL